MIRTIRSALKECVTKLMLKSNRLKNLKNYCTMYKNKFSESGDDRDWRERDW